MKRVGKIVPLAAVMGMASPDVNVEETVVNETAQGDTHDISLDAGDRIDEGSTLTSPLNPSDELDPEFDPDEFDPSDEIPLEEAISLEDLLF